MTSKIKFENIHLIDHSIVLSSKSKEELIHLSEIDKVYVKKNKMPKIYYFWFLLSSSVILTSSLMYFPFDIILLVPILVILTGAIKLHNRIIYELKVCLKDGRSFGQIVPPKSKDKIIETINIIRKEIYSFASTIKD